MSNDPSTEMKHPPLILIPSLSLLAELGRRLNVASEATLPAWARPVLAAVAAEEAVSIAELMDHSTRAPAAAHARHLAMAILHETRPERSLADISALWQQDHGIVLHASRRMRLLAAQSGDVRAKHHRILTALAAQASRRAAPQVTRSRTPLAAH